ncbi:DNA cytosine methyltransferase [Agrococcus citreus]|uniref:DNA (cytosine-5-)-methyltransferase n=1 Tax=Agrococcus citreus TaxID=84643 RepID=A0ABN1YWQ2_9MICO
MPDAIRMLDLFAGAGGLSRGFHDASARFESVTAVEFDTAAAASYSSNFPDAEVHAMDIKHWLDEGGATPGMARVIIGGPPCQGFSTLGKQEVDDERNDLWRQYERTILAVQPELFVVENVAAFGKSPQFAQFRASADDGSLRDYDFEARILNSADYGAPQTRKRAILIGFRRDLGFPGWPDRTHTSTPIAVGTALAHIPEDVEGVEFPDTRTMDFQGRTFKGSFRADELHLGRRYSELSMRRFTEIPRGGNRFDLPEHLKAPCWVGHKTGSGDVMGRMHLDRPSVTIRTEFFKPEKGRYLHPTADRAITHWEAATLQGFPDEHRFVGSKTQIARQIGNAVPIPLGRALGAEIAGFLD